MKDNLDHPSEEALFEQAVGLASKAEQEVFLKEACGGNKPLLDRIARLLAAHEKAGGFMNNPTLTHAPMDEELSEKKGSLIGRYKLLQKIGEGGMGVVYMAEQTEAVTRKVALKIIKLGMDTKQVVARFEAERQALAMMDHPNIAKVLDAGATESGRPYFVMELVRGEPITKYCDKNKLSNQDRLELFIQVCHAIQHAHQKGVIHRDIKPSNVMVTLHDGKAVPKVIDFGIAKATHQKLTEKTLFTNYSQMIGTPAYMSPEQAEMSGLDVDTRTDVYSLGVLLYELLTGSTPFGTEELLSKGYGEMQRIIAEQEPPKPSRLLSSMMHAERTTVARNRRMEVGALNKIFQGDLDWIVMKALDKDRSRRYDTANGLATDIRRYQGNEPIIARPPSFAYRLQKAWRRNKVACLAAALVFLALAAGGIFSQVGMQKAKAAQAREEEQRLVAIKKADEAEEARKTANAARGEIEEKALALKENLYAQSVALAYREMMADRPAHALQLLKECPEELREWEWNHVRNRSIKRSQPRSDLGAPIFDIVVSPNGRDVAFVCGEEVRLAELTPEGSLIREEALEAVPIPFSEKVQWISFSPDGQLLAVKGSQAKITLWDVRERLVQQSFTCSEGRGYEIAFHPSGQEIALSHAESPGVTEATINFYEIQTGRQIRQIRTGQNIFCLSYSPDGKWLAVGAAQKHEHKVDIYNAYNGKPEATLYSGSYPVISLAFSPNSKWLVSAGDPAIKIWQVSDWSLTNILESHSMPITALVFNADGTRLISGSLDREIKIWDPFKTQEFLSLRGHLNGISEICVTTNDRLVSTDCSGEMRVWDVYDSEENRERFVMKGHQERIYSLAFHPTSNYLYSLGDDGGYVWETDTGHIKETFPGIFDLTISRDGRYIVHPGTHQSTPLSSKDASNALSGQGTEVNSRGPEKMGDSIEGGIGLEINDAYSVAHYSATQNPDQKMFFTCDISVDGEWLAGGTSDGEIQVWKRKSEESRQRLLGHHAYLVCVRFSPDGKYLVSLGEDGEILRWDTTRFEEPQEPFALLSPNAIREIAHISFSEDGQRLVTGDGYSGVLVIEVNSGKELLHIPKAHNGIVVSARFSQDDRWIASSGSDYVVRIWDTKNGQLKNSLIGHTSVVNDVAFSPDGKRLASAGWDQTVRIWDLNLD